MSERTAARLAWALAALAIALVAVTATLLVLNWSFVEGSSDLNLIELILPVGFAGVGAIVASRRPSSPIGWLFLAIAVIGAVPGITNQYLLRDLRSSAATLPLTPWMAWLQEWVVSLIFPAGAVMFVFLLLPDGRLLSPSVSPEVRRPLYIRCTKPSELRRGRRRSGRQIRSAERSGPGRVGGRWFHGPVEPHRAIARLFARQHGLITRKQALDVGLSPRGIYHRLAKGSWAHAHRGVYRLAGAPSTWQQHVLAACLAAGPSAVASHRTAGALWDLPVRITVAELTIPETRHIEVQGVIVHRAVRLDRADIRRCDGIPTTGLARTVVDLAAVLSRPQLNSLLDHVLGERKVSASQIHRCLDRLGTRGRRGTGVLSDLMAKRPTGPRSPESTFEWRLLRALSAGRLPAPIPQYLIRLPNRRTARVDFAYPEARLAIEADSFRYHSGLSSWSRDRVRNNRLIALGWRVLAVTVDELREDPTSVADQVARCLGPG